MRSLRMKRTSEAAAMEITAIKMVPASSRDDCCCTPHARFESGLTGAAPTQTMHRLPAQAQTQSRWLHATYSVDAVSQESARVVSSSVCAARFSFRGSPHRLQLFGAITPHFDNVEIDLNDLSRHLEPGTFRNIEARTYPF